MARLATALVLALVCAPMARAQNPIALENALAGTTDWLITNVATDTPWSELPSPGATALSLAEVEGYASATSVNAGGSIDFRVHASAGSVELRFFRLGWYDGAGAREVASPVLIPGTAQPPCAHHEPTHRIECAWSLSHTLAVPASWVSGVYLVKLTAQPDGKQAWIPFVVRNDARVSSYVMQLSVTTWQAYNFWGGYSHYACETRFGCAYPRPKADEVSFDRPYQLGGGAAGAGLLFAWEIHLLRFLEREGRDVAYLTNVDVHARPELIAGRSAFLSVGHDEYWTKEMRDHLEAARNACVDLGFFSANTGYWQVRLASNPATGAPHRRMISYKDEAFERDPLALDGDPANDVRVTGLFRDPRIGRPEASLIGVMYAFWPASASMVVQNTAHPDYGWVFAGTGLSDGSVIPDAVGYEADRLYPGASPPGVVPLASSNVGPGEPHWDYDCTPAGCFSNASIYRTPGDGYVFATGSIQFPWRLDDFVVPDSSGVRAWRHAPAEQMTRNLLDRFRDSPCIETPEWEPPRLPPVFALVPPRQPSPSVVIVDRCQIQSCVRAEVPLGDKYRAILLDASAFAGQAPPPPQVPKPPGFLPVGDLYDVSLVGEAPVLAPTLVQLAWDPQLVAPAVEDEIELLHLVNGPNGPTWQVTQGTRDPVQRAVRVKVDSLSPFVLALPDGDGDAIANGLDNCPAAANADQSDVGGIEPAGPDGIGDACQCGDVDDDGGVRAADRAQLRQWLAGLAQALAAPQKCSVAQPQSCSILDATILGRALGGHVPAPAQACAAAGAG